MKLTSRELAIIGSLAALSAVTQLVHIGYQSPQWGMWLDLVAIFWLVAFFLFGSKSALFVSILGALIITFFAPDTWLGASMKWVATLPMWLILAIRPPTHYQKLTRVFLPLLLALLIRILLVIPLNYFYAIPIWTGMTPSIAMKVIPWYVIAGFNVVQGIIDVLFAWIIVFRFKLSRYARN